MKSFTAGPNENGVRLSRFVESVTQQLPGFSQQTYQGKRKAGRTGY